MSFRQSEFLVLNILGLFGLLLLTVVLVAPLTEVCLGVSVPHSTMVAYISLCFLSSIIVVVNLWFFFF